MLKSAASLSRLRDEVNELIPECAIYVGSASPVWSEVGAAHAQRLHRYLSLRYPEAGHRYWRSRGWGLLIWQPIYLAIIAAHKCQLILPINEMGQHVPISGIPSGVLFRHCRFKHKPLQDCVQRMAEDLIIGCRKMYSYWSVSGLTRKNADRVVADCVLSALLMVYPQRVEKVETLGNLWLSTMGLHGAAELIRYRNSSGELRLALHKKNCCFRYLCHGCSPCDVCPRMTMNERLKRLNQAST
jgi:siderophore ferric iron reductase